jgi:hypothetical protein
MTEKILMKIMGKYRRFLYFLHGRPCKGILPAGKPCNVEDPIKDLTHGDVVHPCVRYIEEGFEGHRWWMVYTPFYAGDDAIENPVLCYADNDGSEAPTEWTFYCTIKGAPQTGYNSDPVLLFKDGRLYVFWREVQTPATQSYGCCSATFGCYVQNKSVTYLPLPLLKNSYPEPNTTDNEISPFIMEADGHFVAYAMHISITPPFIFKLPSRIGSFIYRHHVFPVTDGLGLYDDTKSFGIAIWKGTSLDTPFQYQKTVRIKGTSRLHQPWHLDMFKGKVNGKERLFAVIQSSMRYADIYLAWSDDGEHFTFYRNPLVSAPSIGRNGIYKSTALIVDGKLHLYYTARDHQDYLLNRLFVTSFDWEELTALL